MLLATMIRAFFLALAGCGVAGLALAAPSRLDDIRARGALKCAAYERPGLATADGGLLREHCRAAARALLDRSLFGSSSPGRSLPGRSLLVPGARSEFTLLEAPTDARDLRAGVFDLMFLTDAEISAAGAAPALVEGPPVAWLSQGVLVERDAPFHRPEDLAGQPVCFLQGQRAIDALDRRLAAQHRDVLHVPFEEEVEMLDAFHVRHCVALVGETAELAEARRDKGVLKMETRLLDPPLAVFPLRAATPRAPADGKDELAAALTPIFAPNGDAKPEPTPSPTAPAATLNALFAYLSHCLRDVAGPPGAQLTIAFALKRDGSLLGAPHVAFLRAQRDSDRALMLDRVAGKFAACLPAPITDGLGGAIAGRRLTLRVATPALGSRPPALGERGL